MLRPAAAQAQHVAAGDAFSMAIRPDGSLWTWGRDISIPRAPYSNAKFTTPVPVGTATNWRSLSANGAHVLAIRRDGTLWAWGANSRGALGLDTITMQPSPRQVGAATTWQSVAAGTDHTLAIRADGTLWAWGSNYYGQLGTGQSRNAEQLTPVQVGTAADWQQVSAGAEHTLAIRADGTLWAWGKNTDILGLGPYLIGDYHPELQLVPVQVGTARWRSVAAGDRSSLAVRADGTLWSWGDNYYGQLGNSTSNLTSQPSPKQVDSATTWRTVLIGPYHCLALRQDGTLWAWGSGYLGNPNPDYNAYLYPPQQVGTATNWQEAAPGGGHSLGLRTDGAVWAWGTNGDGQIGRPELTTGTQSYFRKIDAPVAWQSIQANDLQVLALQADQTLWSWGVGWFSNDNQYITPHNTPAQLGTSKWLSLGNSADHAAAIRADGTLWACGVNQYFEVGDGTNVFRQGLKQLGTDTNWQSLAVGDHHTLAVRTDGTLWAWGDNRRSQLGDGTYTTQKRPVQIGTGTTWRSVAANGNYSLALKQDGTLWAWGRGETADPMGGYEWLVAPVPTQVGTGATWRSLAAGPAHVLALRQDGTLWAWGDNSYGQLGTGSFAAVQATLVQAGTARWQAVSTSDLHTLGIRQDGTLWAWGSNYDDQLGFPSRLTQVNFSSPRQISTATDWQQVAAGTRFSAALRSDGSVWTAGDVGAGAIGIPYYSRVPLLVLAGGAVLATQPSQAAVPLLPYPNPAHDRVQLPAAAADATIEIIDLQGRLVLSANGLTFSVRQLQPGLYILRLTAYGKAPTSTRLMVE